MKSGVEILRELAFKEPGTMAMGFIIYPIHNDPKNLKNLRHYDIVGCSWEEALEKRKDCRTMINKHSKAVMLKVIMEVVEPDEPKIIKESEEILYPSDFKITREEKRLLEDFWALGQQLKIERETGDEMLPFAPTVSLQNMHKAIIGCDACKCQAVKILEAIFSFKD